MPQIYHQAHPGLDIGVRYVRGLFFIELIKGHRFFFENKLFLKILAAKNKICLRTDLINKEEGTKRNVSSMSPGVHDSLLPSVQKRDPFSG